MCDFCDNVNPFIEVGWIAPADDPFGSLKKDYCVKCGDDENSRLYDFWAEHPDWDVCIP